MGPDDSRKVSALRRGSWPFDNWGIHGTLHGGNFHEVVYPCAFDSPTHTQGGVRLTVRSYIFRNNRASRSWRAEPEVSARRQYWKNVVESRVRTASLAEDRILLGHTVFGAARMRSLGDLSPGPLRVHHDSHQYDFFCW